MESSPSATVLSPNGYYSSFDFLSLVGLDGHTPNANPDIDSPASTHIAATTTTTNGSSGSAGAGTSSVQYHHDADGDYNYNKQQHNTPSYHSHSAPQSVSDPFAFPSPEEPLDDPSPISLDVSRSTSGQGRRRSVGSNQAAGATSRASASRSSVHSGNKQQLGASPMEVDPNSGAASGSGGGNAGGSGGGGVHNSGHNTPAPLDASDLMNMEVSGAAYDAIQAGILQHQVGNPLSQQVPPKEATD